MNERKNWNSFFASLNKEQIPTPVKIFHLRLFSRIERSASLN
jgi:hypothetical protein